MTQRRRPSLLAGLALGLVLVACGGVEPEQNVPFDGVTWRAVSVTGLTPVAGSEPTFTYRAGTIEGSDGCNHIGGTARLEGARLVVEDLGGTLMACEERIMTVSDAFHRALLAGGTLEAGGGQLIIHTELGQLVFVPALTG